MWASENQALEWQRRKFAAKFTCEGNLEGEFSKPFLGGVDFKFDESHEDYIFKRMPEAKENLRSRTRMMTDYFTAKYVASY
jgi:hypothetical protein